MPNVNSTRIWVFSHATPFHLEQENEEVTITNALRTLAD